MEEYKLNLEDLIVNTMITINEKEKRRVIDYIDIANYKKIIIDLAKKIDIQLFIDESNYQKCKYELENYILIKDNKYVMLPWIENKDLIENFRGYLPLNIVIMFCNKDIPNMIKKRESGVMEKFRVTEFLTEKLYISEIENEIVNLEKKKQKNIKKLQKIRKNKNYYD